MKWCQAQKNFKINKGEKMKQTHERLRDIRKGKKLTQEYVAEYLNTSTPMIWRYESGKIAIPSDRLKKLCQLYNISADYILGLPKDGYDPRR